MAQPNPKTPPPATPAARRSNQLSGVQIMFAAILAISMILAINFSTRLTSSRPLREYYQNIEAEIEELRQQQATLIAERDYSLSDAYVQRWAREEGKMARPGEVLVIPLPASQRPQPTALPVFDFEVQTSPPTPAPWMLWWSLFFDSPPPG